MLAFEESTHSYTFEGRPVPSVTQVLSFLDDFEKVPPATLEAARQFGTHVHLAAALLVQGELDWDSLDDGLHGPMTGLEHFLKYSGAVVTQAEQKVYHPKLRYAGTLDAIVHWRNGLAVVDWKTGSTPPRSVGPQTAAYCAALEAATGQRIKRRYCVQLLDGDYRVKKLDDPRDWAIFQSCLNVYRYKHGV